MALKRIAALALMLLLVVGFSGAQAQKELSDQTLFMTFVPNVQFAPVYVGLAHGYFADAGINLTFEHGDEPIGVDLIAAGERQFGVISGEQVIAARANARPVVFVYEWFQEYPVGIVSSAERGIDEMRDLTGLRVGIPGRFGASYSGLVALLAASGMTERDIELQEIGFNAPEVFCVGAVDASVVYINNEPIQIAHRAAKGECGAVSAVNVLRVASAADMVSNGLVTNEATIANQPELVEAMVSAFDRAVRHVINNPASAYLASAEYVENLALPDELRAFLEAAAAETEAFLAQNPEVDRETMSQRRADLLESLNASFDPDLLVQFEVMMATAELWDADNIGVSELPAWEATQDVLIQMEFIPGPIDLEAAFTNAFLPTQG